MQKQDQTPLWVFLAFSSIEIRKTALLLILGSLVFTFYCVPWGEIFTEQTWVDKIFLINDWSWVMMMVPVVIWYMLSLHWVDKHSGWENH